MKFSWLIRIAILVLGLVCGLRADYETQVTGSLSGGGVWGSGPYTDDSDFNKAAVHAGLISPGQTATIRIIELGAQSNFVGSTANGVTTSNWSSSWAAVDLELVSISGGSNNSPTASISGSTSLAPGESGTWPFSVSDSDGNLYRWRFYASTNPNPQWSYISGGSASGSHTTSFSSSGTYTWIVEVEDDQGAGDSTSIDVVVSTSATYSLNVVNGSGGGSYAEGTVASISADTPGSEEYFTGWSQSGSGSIGNAGASSTTFTMGAGDATVTANYATYEYYLTVSSGSGDGWYPADQSVSVAADSPPYGKVFHYWTHQSGPGSISNANAASTTFTTGSGDAAIAANYRTVDFNWGSTPASVPSGEPYTVEVSVNSGGFPGVTLYKNGAYFASGWYGTQGSTSDTQAANYDASFSDSMNGSSGSDSRSVQITPPLPSGTVTGPTTGTVDVPNAYHLTSISNATDWRWEVDLPGGGEFEWQSVYGTLTQHDWAFATGVGTYKFRAHLRGPGGDSITNEVTVVVSAPVAPSITTHPQTQTVDKDDPVTFSVTASGTTPFMYQWRKGGSSIPGATNSTYSISNAQSSHAGSYDVVVTNNAGSATSASATLTVNMPPVITSTGTASGTVGSAFSYQIAATNNPASYGATNLPPGVTVNTGTGLISGTPTSAGTFNATISATNAAGTGNAPLTITIGSGPVPVITSATTASGTYGSAFSYTITATNPPHTNYDASPLPGGLGRSGDIISGTPTQTGLFSITISATNSYGTGATTLELTVAKANQTINFGALPNKTSGDPPFTVNATTTSGLPVAFSVLSGPATIDGNTVTLTGTGTVTIRASQPGNINYNPAPNVDQPFTVSSGTSIGLQIHRP